jgi:PP-loop superfamily ATP-utilizing enzyme
MFEPSDRILVAVSGGKDSLALWDVLLELGYRPTGSTSASGSASTRSARTGSQRAFADERERDLVEVDLARDYGFDVPTAGKKGLAVDRARCAACPSATCSTAPRARAGTT